MKKMFLLLIVLSLILTGCTSGKIDKAPEVMVGDEVSPEPEPEVNESENKVPIHPDDIKAEITILKPNSIGTVYMEATYTNNSDYPITGYSAKILLKDKNETTYLSTHNTVMPGEISPKFESFGPETGKVEDYEILTLEVTARTKEGNNLYIDYDFKLGEASWWESKNN